MKISASTSDSGNVTNPISTATGPSVSVTVSENTTSQNGTTAQIPDENIVVESDTSSGLSDILQNRWIIIGVAAVGIGAIGVLLLIRKKRKK